MSSEPKYLLMASDIVSNYYIVSSRFCMGTNLVVLPSRYSLIMQVVLAEPGNLNNAYHSMFLLLFKEFPDCLTTDCGLPGPI